MSSKYSFIILLVILISIGVLEASLRDFLVLLSVGGCVWFARHLQKWQLECYTLFIALVTISASHFVMRLPFINVDEVSLACKPALFILIAMVWLSQLYQADTISLSAWMIIVLSVYFVLATAILGSYFVLQERFSLDTQILKDIVENILVIVASFWVARNLSSPVCTKSNEPAMVSL